MSTEFSFMAEHALPPLQSLRLPEFQQLSVKVLRTDLIHPLVSGNKWYKLKYNLLEALNQGYRRVVSFGGAYSNHLHALAWAGDQLGIETVAVVRGEAHYASNPTLQDCQRWGMKLHFVDRKNYRRRNDADYLAELDVLLGPAFFVPEGGSNPLAIKGVRELGRALCDGASSRPDYLLLAAGTGGTMAGLAAGVHDGVKVLSVPVLKGAEFLYDDIRALLGQAGVADRDNWSLDLAGHFGGYGKVSEAVTDCIRRFGLQSDLPLDPIYTAKLMLRFEQLVAEGYFPPGSEIVLVHTGGLQGARSLSV